MRVAVDLSAVATAGTRNYAAGFGPAMLRAGSEHQFKIFCSAPTWALLASAGSAPNAEWEPAEFSHAALRVAWEQTALPWKLRQWRADVCFSPFDTAPLNAPCPVLLAVRNPMPTVALANPDRRPGSLSRARVHHTVSKAACRKASMVFFPTAFASDMLGTALEVPDRKRAVVFHGTDQDFWAAPGGEPPARFNLTVGRYMLFVSRLYPQKRADVLIEAYARWRTRHRDAEDAAAWRLVFVGSHVSTEKAAAFAGQVDRCGITDSVTFATDIDRVDLRALYQGAAAFVLPTEMETFGQPFVESMSAGAPVIAADRGFARELCQDAAMYFPPGDAAALADALERVSSDADLRGGMIARGRKRGTAFSWAREAAETLALLESVHEQSTIAC